MLGIVHRVRRWPVDSQQRARRNAMVAATECAQRRAERHEVADYLAGRTAGTAPATPAALERAGRAVHG
jgi:hypothetical protein